MLNFKLLLLIYGLLGVTNGCPIAEPDPGVESQPECNLWYRNYQWVLQDCVCRVFQNECLMDKENEQRRSVGKTPLVPVSEELCKAFIPKKCYRGTIVEAEFPIPAPCGCNRKPGSIESKQFSSFCHLLKFSSENRKPFLSFLFTRI